MKERSVKGDSKVFVLSCWITGDMIYFYGEHWKGGSLGTVNNA